MIDPEVYIHAHTRRGRFWYYCSMHSKPQHKYIIKPATTKRDESEPPMNEGYKNQQVILLLLLLLHHTPMEGGDFVCVCVCARAN